MLPRGEAFKDIAGFKDILLDHQNQFARALTEKLLAYGMGRYTTATDRPIIDKILAESEKKGSGLRDLVQLVVASEIFRSK